MITEIEFDLVDLLEEWDFYALDFKVNAEVDVEFEAGLPPLGNDHLLITVESSNLEDVIQRIQFEVGHQIRDAFHRKTSTSNQEFVDLVDKAA